MQVRLGIVHIPRTMKLYTLFLLIALITAKGDQPTNLIGFRLLIITDSTSIGFRKIPLGIW